MRTTYGLIQKTSYSEAIRISVYQPMHKVFISAPTLNNKAGSGPGHFVTNKYHAEVHLTALGNKVYCMCTVYEHG